MTVNTSIQLSATDGGYFRPELKHPAQFTTTGTDAVTHSQTIPHTAWTALDFGNITGAPEVFAVVNNDGTNFVQLAIANDGSGIFSRLKAGRSELITPESGVTYYAQANTAGVQLLITAVEV